MLTKLLGKSYPVLTFACDFGVPPRALLPGASVGPRPLQVGWPQKLDVEASVRGGNSGQ